MHALIIPINAHHRYVLFLINAHPRVYYVIVLLGYRESAAFLNRAADQLEEMLLKEHPEAVL